MTNKTDNHDPHAKMELRRYFLRKYHANASCPIEVLDCCQGGGILWNALRKEFPVTSYWGLDMKPKKGRLKLDSVRVLSQPGWPQNVIDIDTYGSPWKHWFALLPNISQPMTLFLTIGYGLTAGNRASKEEISALGLNFIKKIPFTLSGKIAEQIGVSYCLTKACDFCTIIEAREALVPVRYGPGRNARYIGVRLEPYPQKTATSGYEPPAANPQVEKELANV